MQNPQYFKDRVAALERAAPHLHPAIHNLFALLPEPGATFSAAERETFLRAAACVFAMVYGPCAPMKIEVAASPHEQSEKGADK